MRPLLRQFADVAENLETRQRKRKPADHRKFLRAAEALLCNLLVLEAVAPGHPLALWKDLCRTEAGNPVYGTALLSIVDALVAAGMMEEALGWHVGRTTKPTELKPTAKLRDLIRPPGGCQSAPLPDGFSLKQVGINLDSLKARCLVLRSEKDKNGNAEGLPIKETVRLRVCRNELHRINRFLTTADFELLPLADGTFGFGKEDQPVDPTARTLVRIFNDASFFSGGRLYGGFWETMPKEQRRERLRIQGDTIAEADFRQLFLRLCYSRKGLEPPPGDLYDVEGTGGHRDGWKSFINGLLLTKLPLKQFPEGVRENLPKGLSLKAAREAVYRKHGPVADCFECGNGLGLMFTESVILIKALSALHNRGIVALPLHDAVIVAGRHAEAAGDAMRMAYERATGDARGAALAMPKRD